MSDVMAFAKITIDPSCLVSRFYGLGKPALGSAQRRQLMQPTGAQQRISGPRLKEVASYRECFIGFVELPADTERVAIVRPPGRTCIGELQLIAGTFDRASIGRAARQVGQFEHLPGIVITQRVALLDQCAYDRGMGETWGDNAR